MAILNITDLLGERDGITHTVVIAPDQVEGDVKGTIYQTAWSPFSYGEGRSQRYFIFKVDQIYIFRVKHSNIDDW